MVGDEKTCRGLILLGIFPKSSPFFRQKCRVCGFAPHPALSPQAGRGGVVPCGGRLGLLHVYGEKVPEGSGATCCAGDEGLCWLPLILTLSRKERGTK